MATAVSALALEIRGLNKSFAGVPVLEGVNLTVDRGEIHGLIGPNGSGKSTLVKVLSGFYNPDSADKIVACDKELKPPFTSADVRELGIGFVHQDLALVEGSSVADNMAFSARGFESAGGRIKWKAYLVRCRELLSRVGSDIDPLRQVGSLGAAERTLVAIARALGEFSEESILVLDEPTAALPQQEVDVLFDALRKLAENGTALIYISHRLPELIALTDRVTVLRDGRVAGVRVIADTTEDELAHLMIGGGETDSLTLDRANSNRTEKVVLKLEECAMPGLSPVSLSINEGEIVGLTGSVGSGAANIGSAIYGLAPVEAGEMTFDGVAYDPSSGPRSAKEAGVAYLPADRAHRSSFQDLQTGENVLIAGLDSVAGPVWLSSGRCDREVKRLNAEYGVVPPQPNRIFQTLSGGNQQKALLAKWMRLGPRLIVLDEPTAGIDIGSRHEIYERMRLATEKGLSVLWISSDFEEIAAVADRAGVFVDGRLEGFLEGSEITVDRLARKSLGVSP